RYADEYITFVADLEELGGRRERLDGACERAGRDPSSIGFTVMATFVAAENRSWLQDNLRRVLGLLGRGGDAPASWIVGTTEQVAERLHEYADAGVDGVYLQHPAHEDPETVALIGGRLVPLASTTVRTGAKAL